MQCLPLMPHILLVENVLLNKKSNLPWIVRKHWYSTIYSRSLKSLMNQSNQLPTTFRWTISTGQINSSRIHFFRPLFQSKNCRDNKLLQEVIKLTETKDCLSTKIFTPSLRAFWNPWFQVIIWIPRIAFIKRGSICHYRWTRMVNNRKGRQRSRLNLIADPTRTFSPPKTSRQKILK